LASSWLISSAALCINRISDLFPNIWINDRQAIKEAVHFIVSRGYEEIIYLSPPLASKKSVNLYSPLQRYEGFKDASKQLNHVKFTVLKEKRYLPVIEELIADKNKKKAILCNSDIYAIDIMNHLKKNNMKFPDDVGIMGFDNIDILDYITPALTTIDYSAQDIGTKIVDTLVNQISGKHVEQEILLNHSIILRESL
jgi:LacI family transcriptional regulator